MNSTPEQKQNVPYRKAYRFREARELLGGMNHTDFSRLISSGKIRTLDGKKLVPESEIDRYIKLHTKPADRRRGRYNKETKV